MKKILILIFLLFLSSIFSIPCYSEDKQETKKEFKVSYMGTVEAGHIFPWIHFLRVTHGIVNLTTIHGVQVKPWLFTGVGVGAMMLYHKDVIGFHFPIYINGRLTLPKKHFRPFFDFKLGLFQLPHINPSIGYKYAWGKKGGVRLGIGANIFFERNLKQNSGVSVSLGFDF